MPFKITRFRNKRRPKSYEEFISGLCQDETEEPGAIHEELALSPPINEINTPKFRYDVHKIGENECNSPMIDVSDTFQQKGNTPVKNAVNDSTKIKSNASEDMISLEGREPGSEVFPSFSDSSVSMNKNEHAGDFLPSHDVNGKEKKTKNIGAVLIPPNHDASGKENNPKTGLLKEAENVTRRDEMLSNICEAKRKNSKKPSDRRVKFAEVEKPFREKRKDSLESQKMNINECGDGVPFDGFLCNNEKIAISNFSGRQLIDMARTQSCAGESNTVNMTRNVENFSCKLETKNIEEVLDTIQDLNSFQLVGENIVLMLNALQCKPNCRIKVE
mmetsp:Transcript_12681/g.28002  ORF Transcript_12681/g.28002 Transcript_12681/m.28002 type:complete len:331 (-) Transcript_12681:82-1074(-)